MGRALACFVGLAVLPLAGCGGGEQAAEWPGPGRASAAGVLDVRDYNAFLAKHPNTVRSPLETATEFLRLDRTEAQRTSVVSSHTGERATPARVVVTLDGLPDDSIRAVRYAIAVRQTGTGRWELRSARLAFACRAGRGHRGFSAARCL